MGSIQAVIFDLFGTLIYLGHETKPYLRLFNDIGLQSPDEFRVARRIALTEDLEDISHLVRRLKPNLKIDTAQYQKEVELERASALLYPETIRVLAKLRKQEMMLGLISNLGSPYKKPFFDLGLDKYFDEVLFSCDIGLKKLDISPDDAFMTGDNIHTDVVGPKSIGMNAVYLNRTNNSPNTIQTLEGIFQYL